MSYSDKISSLSINDFEPKNNGVYITNKDFKGSPGMIKIYAPWCGHCHNMIPTINELSKKNVNIGIINGDDNINQPILEHIGLEGFPSLYLLKKSGRLVEYKGPRTKSSIESKLNSFYV